MELGKGGDRVQYTKETVTNQQRYYTCYVQGNIINTMHCGLKSTGDHISDHEII